MVATCKNNLLPLSIDQSNFFTAKNEWVYIGLFDNEDADVDCQLCGLKEIRYEYTIKNKFNDNKMIVRSSCISKFIDHMSETHESFYDNFGTIVTIQRLEDDKIDYWEQILFNALDHNFINNDFQRSITAQIKEDGKLTINQAKYLRTFYKTLSQNEQTAFRNMISIKLRREKHKDQYEDLGELDK